MDVKALEHRSETLKKEQFEKWLSEPMVRMGLSMVPPGDKQEVLKTLLQSAFNTGFNTGTGDMIRTMLEMIMKDKPK